MRSITKLGAVLVAAVTLLGTSAWADPGKGKSDQWFYTEWDVGASMGGLWVEMVPCLGESVLIEGVFRVRVNVHSSPGGYKTYTRHFVQQDGDIVATGLVSGKQYFLKGGMCWNENAHGPWETGGNYGTDTIHMVFESENGERLVLHGIALFSMQPVLEFKKFELRWNCK